MVMSSSPLLFSSTTSNLLLIPSRIFNFTHCSFHLNMSMWVFKKNLHEKKRKTLDSFYCYIFKSTIIFFYYILVSQSVHSLSRVRLFVTPWIAACQASLSITNSRSLLKLMSIESVMPSSHLILCRPLLLLPPIPPSIRVFSIESSLCMRWPKYWSFSVSISPSNATSNFLLMPSSISNLIHCSFYLNNVNVRFFFF